MNSRFKKEFFLNNRNKLIKEIPNSLVVLSAHSQLQESADLAYPFRQDSSFWYFTGLKHPDQLLVIDTENNESILLIENQNDYQKEWDGVVNLSEIKKQSGIKKIEKKDILSSLLKQAKSKGLQICYLAPLPEKVEPYGFYSNPSRKKLYDLIKQVEAKPKDIRKEVARIRQVKETQEIEALKDAIKITSETLEEVKLNIENYKTEKEIESLITAGFYSRQSQGHGYEPIVAYGKNASTIHYNSNNSTIGRDGLILLDVGAKVDNYSADISRTWQISKSSERQKQVFDEVLNLQDNAFNLLKSGVNLREYQKIMESFAQKSYKKLKLNWTKYPHGFSHFLGLDVHDAGDYEQPLKTNTVITVEPGIYIAEEGIGVRIEDNILIQNKGIKNLSSSIPRDL